MVSKSSTRLVYSFIQYSSLMLFLAFSVKAEASTSVIYYGDSEVSIGEPFSISCIVSIHEPIQWIRNGVQLDMNDRSYLVYESYMQDSEILKPNYDVPEQKLKLFTIRGSLMISCNVTTGHEKLKLEWTYNNESVSKAFQGRHFVINNSERRFTLDRAEVADVGLYECHLPQLNASAQINVIALPMAKLPKNTPVVEGERLTITCVAIGTNPVFYWSVGNLTYKESDDRVILSKDEHGHENAVLSYEVAELSDRGDFSCHVKNNQTFHIDSIAPITAVTYVRVKGKLAALWPFIGIVAEVFVLCAIILIYEKRRNKQEPEESDTDSPEIKNDQHGKDSEVRQRK